MANADSLTIFEQGLLFLLALLEDVVQGLYNITPNRPTYEDGSPVLQPCTNAVDAAIVTARYAHHFLFVAIYGGGAQVADLWRLLGDFC